MKVYLRKGHHSVYDDLVSHPPEGIEYVLPKFVSASNNKAVDSLKKRAFSAYLHTFNKPHAIYVNNGDAPLIHACSGIMIKNQKPWVIDVEHAASFVGFEAGRLEKVAPAVEKLLSSEWCRKVMPWSNAAKMSIERGLDSSKFSDKVEVVYPAIEPSSHRRTKHDGINLLFVSVRFFTKGGRELLEAYELLKKKYDLKLTVISNVPDEVKKSHPDVEFHEPNVPRKDVMDNFFPRTDIFVLPSYMDTFGMVFLEAMSAGVPVVSTNVFAIPEILGRAGRFVDVSKFSWYGQDGLFAWDSWKKFENYCEHERKPDVVKALAKEISALANNTSLRKRMGSAGVKEVESGKFSIARRNRQLRRIYDSSVDV
jgi:glycosyltransferase involved in cell wall biosynthesis